MIRRISNMDPEQRSRGQLVMLTAVVIGFMLVSLAGILHSGILTETLKSQPVIEETNNIAETSETIERGVGELILSVSNEEQSNPSNTVDTVIDEMENQLLISSVDTRGASFSIDSVSITDGVAIRQQNRGSFIDQNNDADWPVADANGIRRFQFDVDRNSLVNVGDPQIDNGAYLRSNVFHVRVEGNSGNEYRMYIYRHSGGGSGNNVVVAGQLNNDPVEYTGIGENSVEAGLVTGTVGGQQAFDFPADQLEGPYDVSIRNGDEAEGVYTMTVDGTLNPSSFNLGGGNEPYSADVVYSAELDISQQARDYRMTDTITVEPCSVTHNYCPENGGVGDITA